MEGVNNQAKTITNDIALLRKCAHMNETEYIDMVADSGFVRNLEGEFNSQVKQNDIKAIR